MNDSDNDDMNHMFIGLFIGNILFIALLIFGLIFIM